MRTQPEHCPTTYLHTALYARMFTFTQIRLRPLQKGCVDNWHLILLYSVIGYEVSKTPMLLEPVDVL